MTTPTETHPIGESNGTSLDETQARPGWRNRRTALYRVTHKQSGGDYVGISVKPTVRWRQHRHDAAAGSGFIFHRALRKYGPDAFEWKVIAWCNTYAKGIPRPKSAEVRAKISCSLKGNVPWNKGKHKSVVDVD